jgi:hypothetical protein
MTDRLIDVFNHGKLPPLKKGNFSGKKVSMNLDDFHLFSRENTSI